MAHGSSDEEEDRDAQRPRSRGDSTSKRPPSFNGAAFVEVVRASMKAKELEAEAAAAAAKTKS
jgi:hypothetical protein